MQSKIVYPRFGKPKFFLDGKEVDEQIYRRATVNRIPEILEAGQAADGHRLSCWPMVSDAMSVATDSQREQVYENARRQGVRVDFDKQGRVILESQGHRRQVARLMQLTDRNAGYGDPVGEAVRDG